MAIKKIFQDEHTNIYCADAANVFRPYPANDTILESAEDGIFTLKAGRIGKTAFQIIIDSKLNIEVKGVYADEITCLLTEGVDLSGSSFTKTVKVESGKPWSFWCLLDGRKANSGVLNVTVELTDGKKFDLEISLEVSETYNTSFFDKDNLSRLEWLNSTAGIDDTVTKGYTPVRVNGNVIHILGRDITVSDNGFIESIGTYFKGNNSSFAQTPSEILASPIEYEIFEDGKKLAFESTAFSMKQEGDAACSWNAVNVCGNIVLEISGTAEFDGNVRMDAAVRNAAGRNLSVRLLYSPRTEFSKYIMGLGLTGRKTPDEYTWKWDENIRQDSIWNGSVNGGVLIKPTAKGVASSFVNIYFHHSRNHMPLPWVNDGKGYFSLQKNENTMMFFDSGAFIGKDVVSFCAELIITPLKKVDMKEHWNTHYYHKTCAYTKEDITDAVNAGCTHVNLHHGNETLPFLNYPMYDIEPIKELADMVHEADMGLKIYYTVRELSTRIPELSAFRSLGTEIFALPTYNQGGLPWHDSVDPFIIENFGDDAIPAWRETLWGKFGGLTDPTVIVNPDGRIGNFYAASLEWLVKNTGIDGIYIDDTGNGKDVVRRVRRIFDRYNPDAKIDMHTCIHFSDSLALGFGFGHNMLMYMSIFPYIDSLWIGEGYNYDANDSDYLLLEISGLPFGLMSEMLEGDCNVWRGMLYGMTSRYPYCSSVPSPVPIWNMRRRFDDAQMIGFWEDEKPVWADHEDVFCTTYYDKENDRLLCCFANFGDREASFHMCGTMLENRSVTAPFIENIQDERVINASECITIPQKGGIMVIIE